MPRMPRYPLPHESISPAAAMRSPCIQLLRKLCYQHILPLRSKLQARWDPIVLEQCQQIGMAALVKTMEMASPKPRYVRIVQGTKEPFLPFVEKIAAAIERQVEDDNLRQLLVKQLARDNANEDCRKVIDSLPGDPSVSNMVHACVKIGTIDHKMSALAAVLRPQKKCFECGQTGHKRSECTKAQSQQRQGATKRADLCKRCGKPGHHAKNCRSKYHANGRLIGNSGNGKKRAKGKSTQTQALPLSMPLMQA
uniref:CCHC-type domain-containing protein n=1 Tax=Malurus cyaneus samueli TaxID=2593467 RepID=A0A8C5X7Z7_9PASS